MSRDALVVGVNTYQYLPSLKAPARDAEAIAHQLHTYGECRVHRLPEVIQAGKPQIGHKTQVGLRELETALINLFKPKGRNIPQTAIFYFSGHGIQREAGIQEGYLALSDSNPDKGFYGLSLFWLRRLLQESPVRQRVIWLDCCHSGELLNFLEADPGAQSGTDRLFMAASRDYETAYESLDSEYSVFTNALLGGLDPNRVASGVISNHALTDWVNHSLKGEIQQPLFESSGSEIILTRQNKAAGQIAPPPSVQSKDVCPYRGLEFFDESHAEYFFGRDALTAQLLKKLTLEQFVAVTGSSGSGKSSLVRAGLLTQLRQGRKVTGSDRWKIRLITPTEHPLKSLASAFIDPELVDLERAEQLRRAETFLQDGGLGLAQLVRASLPSCTTGLTIEQRPRFLLVIDQFEEVFTLSQGSQAERERQEFFDCLVGALNSAKDWLSVVIVLRADFLNKCAFYEGLAQQIAQHQITVSPLKYEQIKATIVQPAQKVGLVCEPNLVYTMMMDVIGAPGELPLLQYTLLELWQRRRVGEGGMARLTLDAYQELGGVRGTLQKRATEMFHSLNSEEQGVAKRIFLALTQLGEGTEDTRRRVMKSELVSPAFPMALVDQVLEKLVAAKLVIISQGNSAESLLEVATQPTTAQSAVAPRTVAHISSANLSESTSGLHLLKFHGSDSSAKYFSQEIVDVTHEALIRNWSLLRGWLDAGREVLRRQRRIEQAAQEWDRVGQPTSGDYLLSGLKLRDAEDFIKLYPQELSALAEQYLSVSVMECRRARRQSRRSQIAVPSVLAATLLVVLSQYYGVIRSQAEKENQLQTATAYERTALARAVLQDKDSDPMTALLLSRVATQSEAGYEAQSSLRAALQNLRFQIELPGHQGAVQQIAFSPDQRHFGTAGVDGTIRLWTFEAGTIYNAKPQIERVLAWDTNSTGGQSAQPAQNASTQHTAIRAIAFSSDGQQLAVMADGASAVKIWSVESGTVSQQLTDTAPVKQISFSPTGDWIAVLNQDGSLSLWQTSTGSLKARLSHHSVVSFQMSADGHALLTAGADGTAQLWQITTDANGLLKPSLVKTLAHPDVVYQAHFSASGQEIITLCKDGKIREWGRPTGKLLRLMPDAGKPATVALPNLKAVTTAQPSSQQPSFQQLEFGSNQQKLAALDAEHQVWLWNLESNYSQLKLEGQENLTQAARQGIAQPELLRFSPNGQLLVTTSATDLQNAYLWDSHTGKLLDKLPGHQGGITSVQFTPDGTYILTADATGNLRLWSAEQGGELPSLQLEGETEWATFLPGGILPQANQASRAGGQGTWQKWQPTKLAPLNTAVTQIAMTQTAVTQMVAVAANGQIRQWKILTEPLTSLENNAPTENGSSNSMLHLAAIQPQTTAAKLRDRLLAFWPGSEPVHQAAVSGFMQLPQAAMVNPFPSQPLLDSVTKSGLPDSRAALTGFALNTDGSLLAKADIEGGVSVYQTETEQAPRLLYRIENWRSLSQTTEPLSEVVPLRSSVKHSSANQPQVMAHNVPTAIRYLMFSLNGQQLLGVADDLTIRVWDARSGQEVTVLRGHSATIRDAHFSADGQWIISAGWDKTARIWNVSTGQEVKLLKHTDAVSSAKFSPDGQRVVTTSWDGSVKLWQVATGQAQMSLDQHQKSVLDAAFSPDGTQIVTASIDGTARLWDAASGKEQAVLKPTSANGQSEPIVRAFFSPDGQYVATLGQSGRVSLWAATWDMLLHLAQERSLRQLTPEECSRYLRLPPNQCPSLPL